MEFRKVQKCDVGPVHNMMYSSGVELYDYIFRLDKVSATDFIKFEFESGDGFCGYKNVTVALEGGRIVGAGCFYDGSSYRKLALGTLKNVFKFYGPIKSWLVLSRMRHIGSVMRVPKKSEVYLSNFGVCSQLRGKGIGRGMIEHEKIRFKSMGYKVLSLDVADNNPRAESLYLKLGFTIVRNKNFSGKTEGIPNSREMHFTLQS